MKALDAQSLMNLEHAARVLGDTERVRAVVQLVYDLGMVDGALKQIDAQSVRMFGTKDQVPA